MPRRGDAESILELLTSPNPTVPPCKPKSKTNTKNTLWFFPKQVKEWEEFKDLDIFTQSIVGDLLSEAQKKRRLSFPLLNQAVDCVVHEEKDTERLFNIWNKAIVSEALLPVQQLFNPVVWVKGKNPKAELLQPRARSLPERTPPPRKCSNENRKPKKTKLRINPDSGSSLYREFSEGGTLAAEPEDERFPKDYKLAAKWKSNWMAERELLDESGNWEIGKQSKNESWPIAQAYTYCVQCMCRYGAILTCEEAFLFRIKPLDPEPVDTSDDKSLQKSLRNNGLMEYTSIPWTNQARAGGKHPREWTVNLALWFMHILAGNNFRVGWDYGREDELRLRTLSVNQWNSSSPATQRRVGSGPESSVRRRTGGELASDDSDSGNELVTELIKDCHQVFPSDVLAASEDGCDTEPNTPKEKIAMSSFDDSPFRKRKRGEDAPNWSFSSKQSF